MVAQTDSSDGCDCAVASSAGSPNQPGQASAATSGTTGLAFSHPVYSHILEGGAPLAVAETVVIGFHGRGGRQDKIFETIGSTAAPDVAVLAPAAAGGRWWTGNGFTPVADDDPDLLASLEAMTALLDALAAEGVPRERIVLAGFSQGSALVSEYLDREGGGFRGIVAVAGGIIGAAAGESVAGGDGGVTDGLDRAATQPNDLQGQRITFAARTGDPKVSLADIHATAEQFRARGADVALHVEPGDFHKLTEGDGMRFAAATRPKWQTEARVETPLADGGRAVAILEQDDHEADLSRIAVRTFDRDGAPTAAATVLAEAPTADAVAPVIETLADGRFVVAFVDGEARAVRAQRFTEDGSPAGARITVAEDVDVQAPILLGPRGDGFLVLHEDGDGARQLAVFTADGTPADVSAGIDSGTDHDGWLAGGRADNVLDGRGGDDTVTGRGGDDMLFGGDGRDVLRGQKGADTLHAGTGGEGGADRMIGGADADHFVLDGAKSRIVVVDFESGVDKLVLAGPGRAGLGDITVSQTPSGATRLDYEDTAVLLAAPVTADDIVIAPCGDFLL